MLWRAFKIYCFFFANYVYNKSGVYYSEILNYKTIEYLSLIKIKMRIYSYKLVKYLRSKNTTNSQF